MNRYFLYALGVYLTFLCCGVWLNTAHCGVTYSRTPAAPQADPAAAPNPAPDTVGNTGTFGGGFPYTTTTSPSIRIKEAKPCREYLMICERSCRERGDLFRFVCIGQDFQPYDDHSRCQCGDDLTGNGVRISRAERER